MDLHSVLHKKPNTPYARPPPIKVTIVAILDQPRVLVWDFSGLTPKPGLTTTNKIVAISDGKSVAKFTLFEKFAKPIQRGKTYILRQYKLQGDCVPLYIQITKDTQFFSTVPATIPQDLIQEGEALLQPASQSVPLAECSGYQGFISVEGEVIDVSSVTKVIARGEPIPLKNMKLQKDTAQVAICLWREAALQDLHIGSSIKITHLKVKNSSYGLQLHSNTYTTFLANQTADLSSAEVVGVLDSETPEMIELLLSTDNILKIERCKWEPFAELLNHTTVHITYKCSGNLITEIQGPVNTP